MTIMPWTSLQLLVAVTVHLATGFVQFSPNDRNPTDVRIGKSSPLYATIANSTTEIMTQGVHRRKETIKKHTFKGDINRAYRNGKPKGPVKNENHRRTTTSPTIQKVKASPQFRNGNNGKKKTSNRNHKRKKTSKEHQFQWLHWVYKQWVDTSPGDLTDENVLKQMMAAIPRWSKRKSPEAAKRAEEILERLIRESLAGNPHMRTNATTSTTSESAEASSPSMMLTVSDFNAAMDAYGKIGDPAGVQRILRRMEALRISSIEDFSDLQPDEFSMSTLATAWAKSYSDEAAQKAEAIIQYMDLKGLIPNTITYNSILHAIAVGNECDRALKAEDIVQRMKQRHEEKGEDCQPDVYTYQSLIQAWSRTSLPGAPQKAEQILQFMDDESSSGKKNCHRLAPNAYCFTTVIHTWARSSEKHRARKAYQLLNVMTRRYHDAKRNFERKNTKRTKSMYKALEPNVKTFTSVLNACARPASDSEKADAFAIAQLTMAELSVGTYGKPNFLSFAAYLSVCGTALEVGPERDAEVQRTFENCVKAGEVAQIVLEKLHSAASPELLHELIGAYLDDGGHFALPKHWTKSIKGERPGGNTFVKAELYEEEASKISKASQQRLEDVSKFGGTSSIYSESNIDVVGKGDELISWSNDEFSWGANTGK
ncbi:unnamed protein product [Pseudo-nitzschia multistriata]|uniref:Pentacotripeptide-repeat region of PRORP domain-containing protein n=1 Tax=Pseudo-nitzschia multistriata TaxID=183589 RepID=A0A448ZFB2_9STRA|nr:unnamed protein product [Pseudo-nitzschia multistriata]